MRDQIPFSARLLPAIPSPLYSPACSVASAIKRRSNVGRISSPRLANAQSVMVIPWGLQDPLETAAFVWRATRSAGGGRTRSVARAQRDEATDCGLKSAAASRLRSSSALINCSRPEAVTQAMPILAQLGKAFGGYANGFVEISAGFLEDKPTVDALSARQDLSPEVYAAHAMDWIAEGATMVGGCCEVGPAHIAEMARRLRADGHTLI